MRTFKFSFEPAIPYKMENKANEQASYKARRRNNIGLLQNSTGLIQAAKYSICTNWRQFKTHGFPCAHYIKK